MHENKRFITKFNRKIWNKKYYNRTSGHLPVSYMKVRHLKISKMSQMFVFNSWSVLKKNGDGNLNPDVQNCNFKKSIWMSLFTVLIKTSLKIDSRECISNMFVFKNCFTHDIVDSPS